MFNTLESVEVVESRINSIVVIGGSVCSNHGFVSVPMSPPQKLEQLPPFSIHVACIPPILPGYLPTWTFPEADHACL